MERTGTSVVVGFGGYVALPAYLGARTRVPIVVHEANAKPGLANRVGARLTPFVAETVAGSLPHATLTGLPLRPAIAGLDRAATRPQARAHFGLEADRRTLLVFGGSQGARHLNAALASAWPRLAAAGIQVLHVVGPRNEDGAVAAARAGPPYVGLPYCDRMDLAYAAADLAVCRAGAMTCAELAAVGLPGVYVPLPIGNGEQRLNALPVVRSGGGVLVDDADLTGDRLLAEVTALLGDPSRLASMASAAAAHGHADAADLLVDLVERAAATKGRA